MSYPRRETKGRQRYEAHREFAVSLISAGLLLAAPAFACLATPAPGQAWDKGAIEKMQYPKGEDGPMAPIMGGQGKGGIPTAAERANERFPNDDCPTSDMHWCSEGIDPGSVSP